MKIKKKLIEVALPLDAINTASAREKSIRHGHPSTLHLWWARRPLAAARAVIFAQMVDDPSGYVDVLLSDTKKRRAAERELKKRVAGHAAKRALARDDAIAEPQPTLEDVIAEQERDRLFAIIENLVLWENTTNEEVLETGAARDLAELAAGRARRNAAHPRAAEIFRSAHAPGLSRSVCRGWSTSAGGAAAGAGSPCQRPEPGGGADQQGHDRDPAEILRPAPVNPTARQEKSLIGREWKGAQELAEDVRYYGQWMREEAEKRIGHLYPKVEISEEMVAEQSDLERYKGRELTVIAWLWGAHGEEPEPGLYRCRGAAGVHLHALDQNGQRSVRRAGD